MFDFRGFGKSDGDTGATTVDQQLDDARMALAYLGKTAGVDKSRIGVLGFSLGGGIAMLLAADQPGQLKALATWSSVGDFHKDFLEEMGQATFDKADKEGIVGLDLGWRTIALKKSFFDSLSGHDLRTAIGAFPGAYLAIAGSKDFSAAYPTASPSLPPAASRRSSSFLKPIISTACWATTSRWPMASSTRLPSGLPRRSDYRREHLAYWNAVSKSS